MKFNTSDDLRKQESETLKKTIDESPEIFWFNEFYKNLQKILFIIPENRIEEEFDESPSIFLLLLITTLKIVHTSNSIMNLISRGYYHQGMILLRSIQEEFHHLLFFTYHPKNDIKLWVEGRLKSKNINKFAKKSSHIPKRWKGMSSSTDTMYAVLSRYVHPSIDSWSSILKVQINPLDVQFKILPRYEENSFDTVFTGVLAYLGITMDLLMEVYETEIKEAGIWEEIVEKIDQCNLEYMTPIMKLMSLDDGTNIIG